MKTKKDLPKEKKESNPMLSHTAITEFFKSKRTKITAFPNLKTNPTVKNRFFSRTRRGI